MRTYCARRPNVVVSDRPDIQDEYSRSSIVLYRASTAVLGAVLNGLRPVWVFREGLTNTDPLYRMKTWRRTCRSPEEFVTLMEDEERIPPDQREAEWRDAADHLAPYAEPVEDDAIDAWLSSMGLQQMLPVSREFANEAFAPVGR